MRDQCLCKTVQKSVSEYGVQIRDRSITTRPERFVTKAEAERRID